MDRREFLFAAGGAVAGAALAAAGVMALGSRPGAPSAAVPTFLGASHRAGPAPAPLPYLPLRLEGGVFAGAPQLTLGDATLDVTSWFRYCGLDAPGLAPNYAGTEKLSYYWSAERDDEEPPWFADRAGQHVAPEDFPTGRGALVRWRSRAEDAQPILALVIPTAQAPFVHEHRAFRGERELSHDEFEEVKGQLLVDNRFIAVAATCTHFCCRLGYNDPALEVYWTARQARDRVFCPCHHDSWDPLRPVWGATATPAEARRQQGYNEF